MITDQLTGMEKDFCMTLIRQSFGEVKCVNMIYYFNDWCVNFK